MKMKSNVILNDDKVIKERLKYCVHITLGRFLRKWRDRPPSIPARHGTWNKSGITAYYRTRK